MFENKTAAFCVAPFWERIEQKSQFVNKMPLGFDSGHRILGVIVAVEIINWLIIIVVLSGVVGVLPSSHSKNLTVLNTCGNIHTFQGTHCISYSVLFPEKNSVLFLGLFAFLVPMRMRLSLFSIRLRLYGYHITHCYNFLFLNCELWFVCYGKTAIQSAVCILCVRAIASVYSTTIVFSRLNALLDPFPRNKQINQRTQAKRMNKDKTKNRTRDHKCIFHLSLLTIG